ncbi:MAG: pimeloyl-[acyl-carrier protein] synthase [Actinomycetota bacterium]|jgi:cytochrome P450|nr:pimeloyl-[acyl-carrier protein] synthase [Actinomycetota bacterium]
MDPLLEDGVFKAGVFEDGALFDPLAPETLSDPYPLYARLRDEAPVQRTPTGVWLVLGYDPAVQILRDHARFSVDHRNRHDTPELIEKLGPTASDRGMENVMLFKDPPDHTRLRGLVNKAFTPRIVESMRRRIVEITNELIDDIEPRGEMDVIEDFAYPLPVTVIAEMLGIPEADRHEFKRWSRQVAPILDPIISEEVFFQVAEAGLALAVYFDEIVAKRRIDPQDDLITELIRAEDEGDRLTPEELRATLILLLVAGHETTMNLIGNGLLALLRNPSEAERLRSNPALAKTATDELLRYDGSVHLTARTAVEDAEVGGEKIAKGEMAIVILGAANRDPAQFSDPDRLDIGRDPNRHLAFSAGGHFCVGATLARAEGQVAFETLLRRLPGLRLADPDPPYRATITLRGLKALPVSF